MEITISKRPEPKVKPLDSALEFGKMFTDHMFLMDYHDSKGWYDARIVPHGDLVMDPSSMVFHYGQAAFEGLKAYRGEDGKVRLFRPDANFRRLNTSHERLCMPEMDVDFMVNALETLVGLDQDWVPHSKNTSLYIRPFTIATEKAVGVHASDAYRHIIIMSPVGPYSKFGIEPVGIFVEDELVRAVRGGLGFTKAAANYASSLKGQKKAKALGYTQVLWLDALERKYIEEVGMMNILFVIDGEIVTPALNGSILPGITRDSTLTLARSWGMPVSERRISIEEIFEAHDAGKLQEAFGAGTAAVISPVGKFCWHDREIILNNNQIGPVAQRVYDELTGIQYGNRADEYSWVTVIE